MRKLESAGPVRKFVTRALAVTALLGIYLAGSVITTGVAINTGISPAMAQRGRGRGRGGRGRGGGNLGAAIGIGAAVGIIGTAIAVDQARRRDAVQYCMSRFRSYNPQTGTYIGRDGIERPCP